MKAQGHVVHNEEDIPSADTVQIRHQTDFNRLGCQQYELGNAREAASAFREAVRLRPGFAEAHANLGRTLLALGEFQEGWAEHEWRRRLPGGVPPGLPRAPWTGSDPFGRSIVLFGEGGLGNVIQFARYATSVAAMGARVVVQCVERLAPLFRTIPGVWQVVPCGANVGPCELHCPLMSVPAVLYATMRHIPADVPYLFASNERLDRWGMSLRSTSGYKVGIAWEAEQATEYGRQRSIPLERYAILSTIPGVKLFALHRDWTGSAPFPASVLSGLDAEGGAFLDTAAVMKHLDLVITCDTSIAHVAGALGVPVWVAERFAPDWRWMLDREDSPWYPTLRLFRQPTAGDWTSVFARMADELRKKVS